MSTWVKDAIFYQIFPDRFYRSTESKNKNLKLRSWESDPTFHGFHGGDLWGVADKLDELKDLGINALYLNPIFESASVHRYHTYDYFKVDPILGGNEAFHHLLQSAHQKNMRVMLDGVFNHVGRGFWTFHHVLECGADSPYLDWFHIKGFPLHAYEEKERPNYECWFDLHALPKLNYGNPEVRKYILDVATYWIDQGIDGWRLDVPNEVSTDFWPEFNQAVKYHNPEAYILGEIWVDERKETSQKWIHPKMFDAVMNYGFTGACLGYFTGDSVKERTSHFFLQSHGGRQWQRAEFESYIQHILQLYPMGTLMNQYNLLESHDTPRFLFFSKENRSLLRVAYTFLFSYIGAPSLYYGSEWGLSGGNDPDCRRTIPWGTPQMDQELRASLKQVIQARANFEEWRYGDFQFLSHDGGERVLVYQRTWKGQTSLFVLNCGPEKLDIRLSLPPSPPSFPHQGERGSSNPLQWKGLWGSPTMSFSGSTLFIKDVGGYETLVLRNV